MAIFCSFVRVVHFFFIRHFQMKISQVIRRKPPRFFTVFGDRSSRMMLDARILDALNWACAFSRYLNFKIASFYLKMAITSTLLSKTCFSKMKMFVFMISKSAQAYFSSKKSEMRRLKMCLRACSKFSRLDCGVKCWRQFFQKTKHICKTFQSGQVFFAILFFQIYDEKYVLKYLK